MTSDDRYFWCEDGFVCDRTKEAAESTADNPLYEEVEPVEELNRLARMWEWVAREVVLSGYSRADIMQGLHEHDIDDALARYQLPSEEAGREHPDRTTGGAT